MKKYKIISGLLLISVLIQSCCKNKDKYYYVSEKPDYEIGDTLIFSSNLGNWDTFIVQNITQGFDEYENEDYCGSTDNYQILRYYFETSYIDTLLFEITIIERSGSFVVYWFDSQFSNITGFYNFFDTYNIQGISYSNVFEYHKDLLNRGFADTLYYGKSNGIIKYIKRPDNEIFELDVN